MRRGPPGVWTARLGQPPKSEKMAQIQDITPQGAGNGRQRRLGAGVAAADDDIVCGGVAHEGIVQVQMTAFAGCAKTLRASSE